MFYLLMKMFVNSKHLQLKLSTRLLIMKVSISSEKELHDLPLVVT